MSTEVKVKMSLNFQLVEFRSVLVHRGIISLKENSEDLTENSSLLNTQGDILD